MSRALASLVLVFGYLQVSQGVTLNTVNDLAAQYDNIFTTGNRNAASHLWTSFILDKAGSMTSTHIQNIFHGFCAISGSPLPDMDRTKYRVMLPKVGGGWATGITRHCCWPCMCDITEMVRVDTKTIQAADGSKKFNFLVIGDPCVHPEKLDATYTDPFTGAQGSLSQDAPEVKCKAGKLQGAIYSDGGHPIIGMLFDDEPGELPQKAMLESLPLSKQTSSDSRDPTFGLGGVCKERRAHGYDSGMGKIFHLVANINPIPVQDTLGGSILQRTEILPHNSKTRSFLTSSQGSTVSFAVCLVIGAALALMAMVWRLRSNSRSSADGGRCSSNGTTLYAIE